jgi:hypothetical protein
MDNPIPPLPEAHTPTASPPEASRDELVALMRLLLKEPPPDHDFATCPICKKYGITEI